MNRKIIAIIVAIAIIIVGWYALNPTPPVIPWGDGESVDGTMSVELFVVSNTGEKISINNPLTIMYGGVAISEIVADTTLTAVDNLGVIQTVSIDASNTYCQWSLIISDISAGGTVLTPFNPITSDVITTTGGGSGTTMWSSSTGDLNAWLATNYPDESGSMFIDVKVRGSFDWIAYDSAGTAITGTYTESFEYDAGLVIVTISDVGAVTWSWSGGI